MGTLDLGYVDGRRRRKSVYGATRKAVTDRLTKLGRDRQLGLPIPNETSTLARFLESWLADSVKARVKPRTYEGYELIVRKHLVPGLGHVRLVKLTPQEVQRFLATRSDAGLAPKTVDGIKRVLRAALSDAERFGLVARNVAKLVRSPRGPRVEVQIFDAAQARQLIAACEHHRLGALFTTALACGLRIGEALALTWEHVDLQERRLVVSRSLQRQKGTGLVLVEPKSRKSRRTLTLPTLVVDRLKRHRTAQLKERLLAGGNWQPRGFVFTTPVGTPLDICNVHKVWHGLLRDAGLPRRRIHGLRHSCATLLMAQGSSLQEIAALLGHSQISVTVDFYGHLAGELIAGMATKMDEILAPVKTPTPAGPGTPPSRISELGCQFGCQTGENVVSLNFASWNQLDGWLRQVEALRAA